MTRSKALVSWSSGKDSAFALHEVRQADELDVVGLVTTITTAFGRVSMHGVRELLLDRQADALDLPCRKVGIPSPCPNEVYERELVRALCEARDRDGVTHVVFGDLFLADIRAYRERLLAPLGLVPVFPLWQRETTALARDMLAAGLRATTRRASIRAGSIDRSPDATSTRSCCASCRPTSTRAASTASSTRSRPTARCSGRRSRCIAARSSSAMASCSPTCSRRRDRSELDVDDSRCRPSRSRRSPAPARTARREARRAPRSHRSPRP